MSLNGYAPMRPSCWAAVGGALPVAPLTTLGSPASRVINVDVDCLSEQIDEEWFLNPSADAPPLRNAKSSATISTTLVTNCKSIFQKGKNERRQYFLHLRLAKLPTFLVFFGIAQRRILSVVKCTESKDITHKLQFAYFAWYKNNCVTHHRTFTLSFQNGFDFLRLEEKSNFCQVN